MYIWKTKKYFPKYTINNNKNTKDSSKNILAPYKKVKHH